jgi:hypothetical protein
MQRARRSAVGYGDAVRMSFTSALAYSTNTSNSGPDRTPVSISSNSGSASAALVSSTRRAGKFSLRIFVQAFHVAVGGVESGSNNTPSHLRHGCPDCSQAEQAFLEMIAFPAAARSTDADGYRKCRRCKTRPAVARVRVLEQEIFPGATVGVVFADGAPGRSKAAPAPPVLLLPGGGDQAKRPRS